MKKKFKKQTLSEQHRFFCELRAAGVNGTEAVRRAFHQLRNPRDKAYRLQQIPEIKETIEQLKEHYASVVYEKTITKYFEALETADAKSLPKLIDSISRIVPQMLEPERKENATIRINAGPPKRPAHLRKPLPAQVQLEQPKQIETNNKPTNEEE